MSVSILDVQLGSEYTSVCLKTLTDDRVPILNDMKQPLSVFKGIITMKLLHELRNFILSKSLNIIVGKYWNCCYREQRTTLDGILITPGLVWKMVNTWPKKILCYSLSEIGVFDFLLSGIFRKNKEITKSWFLVNSRCFCFAYHANLMSAGKKKRLTFLFITPLILLINMSISLFRGTVQLIKTQTFFATKTTKLCSVILVTKITEFYGYIDNEKSNTQVFFCAFQYYV